MDLLTGDGTILFLAVAGMATTAFSIIREARAQRERVVAEEVPVELRRTAN